MRAPGFLKAGLTRKLTIANACLPILAVLVAYWSSTWGWNSDGKLAGETLLYLVASYGAFFAVGLAALGLHPALGRIGGWITARPGLLLTIWGTYVFFASAMLAHFFDSEALWFGSVGLAYLGFVVAVVALIRAIAG